MKGKGTEPGKRPYSCEISLSEVQPAGVLPKMSPAGRNAALGEISNIQEISPVCQLTELVHRRAGLPQQMGKGKTRIDR
jgi:hypothetical protein